MNYGNDSWQSPPEAESFSLNYVIILTFLITKKCNMFVGGSGQRAVQGISCQFRIIHDCRAEERVNNALVIYSKAESWSGQQSAHSPPQFLPACLSSDLRKSQDRVWRRLGGGSCPICHPPWRRLTNPARAPLSPDCKPCHAMPLNATIKLQQQQH